jgi:hypothetical protein
MASTKPDLARAGTMQVTAKEGQTFLDKNLTDWKKPYLMDHCAEPEEETAPAPSKPKMSKHTTMKGTAKEADALLGDSRPDQDAATRGQQKKLDEIAAEKPPAKKTKLARDNTMAATAKEGKNLLGGQKLSDTRQETKRKTKEPSSLKRATTINKTMEEARAVYGDLDLSGGRSLRKRPAPPAPKPGMKRAGTMQKTAKEGKAFLKRGRKPKAAKKEEEKIEEEEEEEEEVEEQ